MVTTQKLRFCDTDMLGHVNNAVYSVLLEAGRVEMLLAAGLIDPKTGYGVVIARLELDYLRELNWPGEVRIETALHHLGTKSFQSRQKIYAHEKLAARAHAVLAVIDLTTRRAVPIRDDWRITLEQWVVPEF